MLCYNQKYYNTLKGKRFYNFVVLQPEILYYNTLKGKMFCNFVVLQLEIL